MSSHNKADNGKTRYFFGALFVCGALLFPFFESANQEALQQMFALGVLVVAGLLFGINAINPIALATFCAVIFIIAMRSSHYAGGLVSGIAGILLLVVACHVGEHLKRNTVKLAWLLAAIATAAVVNAAEGLLQWLGLVGHLAPWVVVPENRGIAYGAFGQRNLFASFMCVGSVTTIWLFYKRHLSESMAWFLGLILMFGVAASGSRTGIIEVVVLSGWGLLWSGQQNFAVRRLLVGQALLLAGALMVLPVLAQWHGFDFVSAVARAGQPGQDARLTIWDNALTLISLRPWAGWGWYDTGYAHYVTLFSNRHGELVGNVHNLPLQLAVEFGLPATFALFAALLWVVLVSKAYARRAPLRFQDANISASDRPFAWALLTLIVAIHSMLEYPLWHAKFLFLTGFALGYVLPSPSGEGLCLTYRKWTARAARLVALSLVLLAMVAWHQFADILPIYKTPFTKDREVQRQNMTVAIANASNSWLFQEHLDFATLGITEVTSQNAGAVRALAEKLLHHSAEPAVIQPLLLSLWYLQDAPALRFHAERFCRAFPAEFQRWSKEYAGHPILGVAARAPSTCLAVTP